MNGYDDLEKDIEQIGREFLELMGESVPSLFDGRRWKGQLMEWCMRDEQYKVQLFRFIDVLPALKTNDLVARLLHEYFADLDSAPKILAQALGGISATPLLPSISGKIIRGAVESFATQFIAGRDARDALSALQNLRAQGLAVNVDLLGEAVLSDREADLFADRYLGVVKFLGGKVKTWPEIPILDNDSMGPIPKLDVSLKVSSFYARLDPMDWEGSIERTKENLGAILRAAQDHRISVTVDMEHYYLKAVTIAIFKSLVEAHQDFPDVGIALQAYLRDTREDLQDIIAWARTLGRRVSVRLVKGAYWDYETVINRQHGWPIPVFLNKEETDESFEELATILLENAEYVRPALGTHNVRSISQALAVADRLNLAKGAFEFQMIYGMAEPVRTALQKKGYRVRVYTPVGELIPGMGYLIRRLLENTSNESFLRRSFMEGMSFEELMKPPQPPPSIPSPGDDARDFNNEPLVDFSRSSNRERMKQALIEVAAETDLAYPLSIGGKDVEKERHIVSVNPARPAEIVGRVSEADQEDAEEAVKLARNAWKDWRKTSPEKRADYLSRTAEALREQRFELAALEVYEVGKTWKDADADIAEAIDFLEYYAREMVRLGRPQRLGAYPGEENRYLYEPRGVGLVVAPWNFPIAIPAGMIAASLVTGNCTIFKPSSLSVVSARKLFDAFAQSDLPAGVLQFLPGPGEQIGEYLSGHPDVDFVVFTGSKEVGLRIVKISGETHADQRNIKRVIAEMGGKNAIIVDETADLDEAVAGVLESALGYQGQRCSACSRVIVVGDRFDDFCARLGHAMESTPMGPPQEPGNLMGPVIDGRAKNRILRYIEMGREEGNALLVREAPNEGSFVGPVMIADPPPDSTIAQEEIFGPVLTLMRASTIDEAIDIANGTRYALTGGIFSRSPENIRKARNEFLVGNLYINRKITGALVGRQPFGGFGMSGVSSKAGGPDYLIQFMNIRSISENTLRRGFAPEGNASDAVTR